MPVPRTEFTISREGEILSRHILTPGEYVLGSESEAFLVPHPSVAPQHVRLRVEGHGLTVEDLGSAAGTYLDGRRIEIEERWFPNQTLRLGGSVEMRASRLRDERDADPESSCSIQQAHVDRLIPPAIRHRLKYQVGGEVGRGGMGAVYLATEQTIRRSVAMKVMLAQTSEEAVARFIKEAQITGQLEHPNIIPVHELGVDEQDRLFYTMKQVRGVTLKKILGRLAAGDQETLSQYSFPQLLTVFEKVCDAVAFAHSRRVIHRDLKPDNIMLGSFGEVLVMDWGLAIVFPEKHAPASGNGTGTGTCVSLLSAELPRRHGGDLAGTPQYMAPEQARGEIGAMGPLCDVYALGAILHSILFLENPIPGQEIDEVLENVRAGRTHLAVKPELSKKRFRHLGGLVPPASLVAVVRKAMAVAREDRYTSVKELQADVRAYVAGFATRAEQAGVWRHLLLGFSRYRRESILLVSFACVLAVIGGIALVRVLQERRRAESALANLADTAPTFVSQAQLLATQQRFDEALEKLDFALRLQPASLEAHLLKGDLLQSKLRLAEAAAAYRAAERLSPGIARARLNAERSEQLAASEKKDGKLSRQAIGHLYESMVNERRPAALLLPLNQLLGQENASTRQFWRERLNQLPATPDRPWDTRFVVKSDGQLELDLSDTAVVDLSPLKGMPLSVLNLRNCEHIMDLSPLSLLPLRALTLDGTGVSDLAPLKEMKLEELSLAGTRVSDLSPLSGSSLRRLDCSNTPVVDFTPLAQTRLESLSLAGTLVEDIWFLRGLPLRSLRLEDCQSARGYSVLLDLPNLEVLSLPRNFYTLPVEEITSLRALSRQSQIRTIVAGPLLPALTGKVDNSDAFWKQWGADLAWLEVLRRAAKGTAERLPDGSWSVVLRGSPAADLAFLQGARISRLDLFNTPVSNLRPLIGMPLKALDLRLSKVTDLEPLRDMPLKELLLWRNRVLDFSPLSSLRELEVLDLTETQFSDLRQLNTRNMKLLRLGNTKVTDLSPLAGFTLEKLHCDSVAVTSIRPLLRCEGLRWLIPPESATDIELLRAHPTLERLSYLWNAESEPSLTSTEFWEQWKLRNAPR